MRKWIVIFSLLLALTSVTSITGNDNYQRVLFLGDSFTVGLYSTSQNAGYAHLVAAELGADYAIAYAGGIDGLLPLWEQYRAFEPGLVVIQTGLNEVHRQEPLDEWRIKFGQLIDNIQTDSDADIVALTMPNAPPDISPILSDYPLFNEAIQQESAARGVMVADVWNGTAHPKFKAQHWYRSAHPPAFSGDNFHFNDLGHQRIAEIVLNRLEVTPLYFPVVTSMEAYP